MFFFWLPYLWILLTLVWIHQRQCQSSLAATRKNRLQIEDLRRTLSLPADAKKLARMEELLFMQEDIKRARKQFEENEMGGGGPADY